MAPARAQRLPVHTHTQEGRTGCTFQKASHRPSWIRGHYRPLTSVRAWNFENVDQAAGVEEGGGRDRDKKWPIRPFIQTSSLQHCYYNAHKGDRYAARNRIRAIVPSRYVPQLSTNMVFIHLSRGHVMSST